MFPWYQRIVASLSAVALAVVGELAAKYITGSFEVLRVGILLVVTQCLAALVVVVLTKTPRKRVVIDFIFLTIGLVAVTIGTLFSLPGRLPDSDQVWIIKFCLIGLGILESTLAAYAVYIGLTGRDIDFLPVLDLRERDPQISYESGQRVAVNKLMSLRPEHEAVLARFRAGVSEHDLHYVAYYIDGKCFFFVDVLDSPSLNQFFHEIDRQTRRAYYERHGRQIIWLVSALDRSFHRVQGGTLIRTVLDVQYGALYHFPVVHGVDVIGVTLLQEKVGETDEKLAAIKDELADLPRGGKLSNRRLADRPFYLPAPAGAGNVLPLIRRTEPDRAPTAARLRPV